MGLAQVIAVADLFPDLPRDLKAPGHIPFHFAITSPAYVDHALGLVVELVHQAIEAQVDVGLGHVRRDLHV